MDILISVGRSANSENYVKAVERAGGVAHAAYLPEFDLCYDGLILAGGGDMEPSLYGQENCLSDSIDVDRDRAELALLDAFSSAGKPVLGICRGHQVVNVWAGGNLIQDLGKQNEAHRRVESDRVHKVCARSGLLKELYGENFAVNSAHHQAVGSVGAGLAVTACSADGVIEAMEHETLPIFTFQFHPERMNSAQTVDGSAIFRWFIEKYGEK